MWNKDSRPVNELRKIRNGPCLAQQKRGGPAQKSTGKVNADIEYGGKEDFSIEEKEGEHTEGLNNLAAASGSSSSSFSSSSSSAAAVAGNDDDDNDGDDNDDDDGDDCETIYSCDEENDEETNDSDDDIAMKEQPVAPIEENADGPVPVPASNSSGTDMDRAACGVGHLGEEHLSEEAVSTSIPDTVESERPVCAAPSCSSLVEGEVVFWHAGETAADVIKVPALVEAMSVVKEETVQGEEVIEISISDTEHGACPMSDDLMPINSEYDDKMNDMDIPASEVDCQMNQDVVMKDIDCPIDSFEDEVSGAIVAHEEMQTEMEMETEMEVEVEECAAVDVGIALDTEATETVTGISVSMQTQTQAKTQTQVEMSATTSTQSPTVIIPEKVTAPVTVTIAVAEEVTVVEGVTVAVEEAEALAPTPIVTITEAATVTEDVTVTATEAVAVIATAAESGTAEEHMDT